MTLYLISAGLAEKEDMSLRAFSIAKKCKTLYLETYTSKGTSAEDYTKLLKKKVIPLQRKNIEEESAKLVTEAKTKDIGIFIYGHALGATTHLSLLQECREKNVKFEIIHGSSILTAISVTGLSLYNFGKTISIPFHNKNIQEPYKVLKDNLLLGYHTLFLLDLQNGSYMNTHEAINYLLRVEDELKGKVISKTMYGIMCAALGTKDETIIAGTLEQLLKKKITTYPQVLIIPGKMQFYEKEFLEKYEV